MDHLLYDDRVLFNTALKHVWFCNMQKQHLCLAFAGVFKRVDPAIQVSTLRRKLYAIDLHAA